MQNQDNAQRDFSTISPSAKWLLFLKAQTDIPYAREAAEIMLASEPVEHEIEKNLLFWSRAYHFERRYKSIDVLLQDLSINNILELSSGFSFRGLAAIKNQAVHYIDTDLPELIETKKAIVEKLEPQHTDRLRILPLNALDAKQFAATVDLLPEGEIAIVNEGLLMYLNIEEKTKLCSIIRDTLKQRGGYWITADVYVRNPEFEAAMREQARTYFRNDNLQKFFEQHNIDENKFGSFEEAEEFFMQNGLILDKEADVDRTQLTTLPHLLANAQPEQIAKMGQMPKLQTTWRLRAL